MKAIELKNLNDAQWISYLSLLKAIKEKYNDDCYIDDPEWREYTEDFMRDGREWNAFKKERLNRLKELKPAYLNEFVVFDNDDAVAWISYKIMNDKAEFIFDWVFNEVPNEVLKIIFGAIYSFINEHDKRFAFTFSSDERRKRSLAKSGAEHYSELPLSKYLRNQNSENYWKEIIDANQYVKDYELVFCNRVPEIMYDDYFTFVNQYILDKNIFNPDENSFSQITKEQFLKSMNDNEEDDDEPFYIYMLLDKKKIAAICSLYISKNTHGKVFLNHCGGATSVVKNYRGKNIAKFMKAKMYLKCLNEYPDFEYIITNTYPWNKYMYRINEDMGFKDFAVEYKYKLTKEFLEKF